MRICYDILCSVITREQSAGGAKITRIQNDVNIPSDRFREHLSEMETLGLLIYRETVSSTEKGRTFVLEYKKVVDVLKRFGLG